MAESGDIAQRWPRRVQTGRVTIHRHQTTQRRRDDTGAHLVGLRLSKAGLDQERNDHCPSRRSREFTFSRRARRPRRLVNFSPQQDSRRAVHEDLGYVPGPTRNLLGVSRSPVSLAARRPRLLCQRGWASSPDSHRPALLAQGTSRTLAHARPQLPQVADRVRA
jgi:hypothetical protein